MKRSEVSVEKLRELGFAPINSEANNLKDIAEAIQNKFYIKIESTIDSKNRIYGEEFYIGGTPPYYNGDKYRKILIKQIISVNTAIDSRMYPIMYRYIDSGKAVLVKREYCGD